MTAVVRHSETRVPMRAPTPTQNRLAIHLKQIHGVGALENYRTGRVSVHCRTTAAVRAVRHVACAYGMTDVEVTGDYVNDDGRVSVRLNIPCGGA
jgi:hypothetical protein